MIFTRKEIDNALKRLFKKYSTENVNNNNKHICASELKTTKVKYQFVSMKQSVFKNIRYYDSLFKNVALTGSSFENVIFEKTELNGNSFANCSFLSVEFNSLKNALLANNFSQSNFELCKFNSIEINKSGILNTVYHNCSFNKSHFHGSTLEGSKFINCEFHDCDFGSLNLDYTTFTNNIYSGICFPFYQIANIIGAADFINEDKETVFALAGKDKIPISEYREQIDDLILYYFDKTDYFAICNLYIAKREYEEAKSFLLDGIINAINTKNFRMISNFCELARYHGIIDDKIRYKVTRAMDEFIFSQNVPETQLNYYLIYIGKIKNILNEGPANTVTLNYNIKTNTCKKNEEGVKYVNQLVNELNIVLSNSNDINGFNVSISNHSPFEITVGIITIFGNVATIAGFILNTIHRIKNKKQKLENSIETIENSEQLESVNAKIYRKYIDARVDQLKSDLLLLQKEYEGKKLNKHIVEVTQNLKTDLEELYSKDIMIFKIKNKK